MVKIKNLLESMCAETLTRCRLNYMSPLYKCEGMMVEVVLFYTS